MSISKEEQIITVFLQRFNRFIMPALQEIEEKVDRGEELEPSELKFIEQVLSATHDILPKIITNQKYSRIFVGAINYYHSIIKRALTNTQNNSSTAPNSAEEPR